MGSFILPAEVAARGFTKDAFMALAEQLELDTLEAVARVAVDKAQPAADPGAGGRPSRAEEIRGAYDALPDDTRQTLVTKSKRTLYSHLRASIAKTTNHPEGLGNDAMAKALKTRLGGQALKN